MPRKPKPQPATQDQLNELQDRCREERAVYVDAYFEARRVGDTERARMLWGLWKALVIEEHELRFAALRGNLPTAED